ncbi:MAG: CPXCG motif-containing cysteine-rich protein [Verrucomicrobia bacterium]|nr:MAG: CPXCG motif-containing cysteine-rich protein [Verrucomicrobiota bacterium]PYK95601.1 MAG: CPXCG motif-containing cysteine-rich protein [Verrucomicrobiota bacterium]PYL39823.1 MAG: CPXCG motif-containing cysteine-rich protein [Verrucomicrobiota bacterium]PYL57918.1 MAG: CPXCG motif-containing cysteine-rich protein [Verrucomicrobiota bacterium]
MEFLLGTEIICPHCGESFPLEVDTSQPDQSIIEDCTVCCRPINLTIRCRPGSVVDLHCSGAL